MKVFKPLIKEKLRDFFWGLQGNSIKNPKVPDNLRSLLFVCKGNICRSPFAERLAIKIAEKTGLKGKNYSSAGLEVSQSAPSPKEAILVASCLGVHLESHKSRKINYDMMESFDMILAMEVQHLKILKESFPKFQEKIFLLPLFEKKSKARKGNFYLYNITDPYGQSLDQFRACYQRIEECLYGVFEAVQGSK